MRWKRLSALKLARQLLLLLLPALIVAVAILKGLAQTGQFFLFGRVSQRILLELRRRAFEAMLRAISLEGIDPVIDSVHAGARAAAWASSPGAFPASANYGNAATTRTSCQHGFGKFTSPIMPAWPRRWQGVRGPSG